MNEQRLTDNDDGYRETGREGNERDTTDLSTHPHHITRQCLAFTSLLLPPRESGTPDGDSDTPTPSPKCSLANIVNIPHHRLYFRHSVNATDKMRIENGLKLVSLFGATRNQSQAKQAMIVTPASPIPHISPSGYSYRGSGVNLTPYWWWEG